MKYTPTPLERMRRIVCSIFPSGHRWHCRTAGAPRRRKNTMRGLSASPTSGSGLKQLGQQVEHEGRVQFGVVDKADGIENIDGAPAFGVCGEKRFAMFSAGSPKKISPPLCLQHHDGPHDGRDGLLCNAPVFHLKFLRVFPAYCKKGLQVLGVAQQQAFVVGYFINDGQNIRLRTAEPRMLAIS